MRRIGWAALAVGFVLGGWSSEAGAATFTYDLSISGVDGLGLFGSAGANLSDAEFYLQLQQQDISTFSSRLYTTYGTEISDVGDAFFYSIPICNSIDNCFTIPAFRIVSTITSPLYETDLVLADIPNEGNLPSFITGHSYSYLLPRNDVTNLEDGISLSAVLLDYNPDLNPVPLPASLPMFGGALLALGALAYRKRSARPLPE